MGRIFTGESIIPIESQQIIQEPSQGSSIANRFGGFVGKLGRFLNIGTDVQVGVTEKALEGLGIITKGEDTAFRGVGHFSSNIDLLKRIGKERFEENSLGGFFTGQYTPTTSTFGNFIKEVPAVSLGLGADIFLDPTLILGKVGAIGKATGLIGKEIQKVAGLLNQIPAVEKMGNMLGNLFITRFGQRTEFQTLDRTRLIQESLSRKEVTKLVSPIIEKPAATQRRITQIIQGVFEEPVVVSKVSKNLEPLAQEARKFKTAEEFVVSQSKGKSLEINDIVPDEVLSIIDKKVADITGTGIPERLFKGFDGITLGKLSEGIEKLGIVDEVFRESTIALRKRGYGRIGEILLTEDGMKTKSQLTDFFNQAKGVVKGVKKDVSIADRELQALALPIRQELDRVGEVISKINPKLLSEETFAINKGTYFPRLYKKFEIDDERIIESFFKGGAVKIPSARFKKRILTQAEAEAREDLIREAGFPALKGLEQLRKAETRGQFFKDVGKLASDDPKSGWLQLPESKLLGDLSSKFLPKAEYTAIQSVIRNPGEIEKIYRTALTLWKTSKTAYNPATTARNNMTNFFILNPLGGVGPHRLDIYAKTVNEIMTGGEFYTRAQRVGLELGSQAVVELRNRATMIYSANPGLFKGFFPTIKSFHNKVVNFYGNQDKFAKLANFIKGVTEDGLTDAQAMKRANFYLIDYSEVPKVVDWLRTSPVGIPFISFTYGVSKPLAKTLLEQPHKLAVYFKIMNAIQSLNPQGIPAQSLANEQEVLPRWIKEGTFLRLPFRDETGRGQFVNLEYILPFNIIEERSITPSSPALTILASLLTNRDTFTGREIFRRSDEQQTKIQKMAMHIFRQIVPSLAPGGFSFNKLKAAIQGRQDYQGRARTLIPVLLDVLGGIKITPIDQTQEAIKRANERQREINNLRSELSSLLKDKTLFPEEKAKKQTEILERIQESVQR